MPLQAAPPDDAGEEGHNEARYDDDSHGLPHGEALGQEGVGRLPRSDIEGSAERMGEAPVSSPADTNRVGGRETYSDVAPKKLNQPQVRLEGGMGTRSRLHHDVVSSWRDSSALRTSDSLSLRRALAAIMLAVTLSDVAGCRNRERKRAGRSVVQKEKVARNSVRPLRCPRCRGLSFPAGFRAGVQPCLSRVPDSNNRTSVTFWNYGEPISNRPAMLRNKEKVYTLPGKLASTAWRR